MTSLQHLADGLDALDDYVRSRLRQAVAELRTRQDQIDQSLDRPGDLAALEQRPVPTGTPRDVETFAPLNDEESEDRYAATELGWEAGPLARSPGRTDDDEGPPATWLVP